MARLLDDLLGGAYRVEAPSAADLECYRELQERHVGLRLGVTDASVIALAERLGETKVATLDHRHFGVVRPRHVEALELRPSRSGARHVGRRAGAGAVRGAGLRLLGRLLHA